MTSSFLHQGGNLEKLLVENGRRACSSPGGISQLVVAVSFRAAGAESQEGGGDEEPSGLASSSRVLSAQNHKQCISGVSVAKCRQLVPLVFTHTASHISSSALRICRLYLFIHIFLCIFIMISRPCENRCVLALCFFFYLPLSLLPLPSFS